MRFCGMLSTALIFTAIVSGPSARAQDDHPPFSRMLKSADENDVAAQTFVGKAYLSGAYGTQRPDLAAKYFAKAAAKGNVEASSWYAMLQLRGSGVPQDTASALKTLNANAVAGDPLALMELGQLYVTGKYVQKDLVKGYGYLQEASDKGNGRASYLLSLRYRTGGDGFSVDKDKAQQLLLLAANQGDDWAQFHIGEAYETGNDLSRNPDMAVSYYLKSAHQGNREAEWKVGSLYQQGTLLPQDYKLAGFFYTRSAKKNYPAAEYALGSLFLNGIGTTRNPLRAYVWIKSAALQGDPEAQRHLPEVRSLLSEMQIEKGDKYVSNMDAFYKDPSLGRR